MSSAFTAATAVGFNSNQRIWRSKPSPFDSVSAGTIRIATAGRSGFVVSRATVSSSTPDAVGKDKKKRRRRKKKTELQNDDGEEEENKENENEGSEITSSFNGEDQSSSSVSVIKRLDEVNPVGLGRRSRQIFDEVWRKFSGLGQISRTNRTDDEASLLIREGGPMCEFAIPGAQNTTVLVVGATSRVGRIVVRKLMLRGYTVKALVRSADQEVAEMLPTSVELVIGDVGEPSTLADAVQGCNKIIYCATARSTVTVDLNRVDHQGVYNLTKALQDYNNKLAQMRAGKSSKSKLLIAKFKSEDSLNEWEVRQGTYFQDVIATKYDGGMDAKFEFTETGEAVFSGYVFTRGGYVELSKKLSLPLGYTLDRYEGLVFSVGGNGRSYILILEAGPSVDTTQSKMYFARISTKAGFCRVRVPFSSFRPVNPDDPPLDPFLVHTLTIRFEPRRQRSIEGPAGVQQDLRSFKLILEYIKALPTGQETDFVLVSCTGLGIEPSRREQVAALFIDQDWIAEHARQVGRMLLGGIKVIGIYIWASESSFKNSTITMCQTVKAVAKAAPFIDADSDERLLVHICYSPMRWTTRNCSLASNITSSSLRPCDFKMGKILTSLQAFRCTYAFDFRVPICRGDESNITRLADILHHCISLHAKELKCAKALIDGKLAIGDEQVASGGVHDVEFLLPFMQDKFDACSQKDIIGVLVFAGAVCSYAYLTAKEQLSQAMTDIKEDIILSLKSRLDIICDATERGSDAIDGSLEEAGDQISAEEPVPLLDLQLQRKNCSLLFPRRVFIPWLANTYVCDYIQPSETVEVLNDHCAELMSIEVPIDPSRILEPESEAPISATTQSFWDMLKQHSLLAKPDLSKHEDTKSLRIDQKSKNSAGFNMLIPFLVLILSLVVGVVTFSMMSS